jgi:hypothetical protein
MHDKSPSSRKVFRFSLGMLLLLTTCVCGYLGGYRAGYPNGDNAWHYNSTYDKSYNVFDLVVPIPSFDPTGRGGEDFSHVLALVNDVGAREPKDGFRVRVFKPNLSIVVTARGTIHRRIQAKLEEVRKVNPHDTNSAVLSINVLSSAND